MTRILLLALILLPTVFSNIFEQERTRCGSGKEFICLIRPKCKDDGNKKKMVEIDYEARSYKPVLCNVHVMIKQYNTSSYLIRFITSGSKIEIVQEEKYFGCELKDGKWNATTSGDNIITRLLSPPPELKSKQPIISGKEMLCELLVVYSNGDEVFPGDKNMILKYTTEEEEELTIDKSLISPSLFEGAEFKCDPNSIQIDEAELEKHEAYYYEPILAPIQNGYCEHKNYKMVFIYDGEELKDAKEAKEISCEMKKINGCEDTKPPTCDWKYRIKQEGKKEIPLGTEFKAACRQKVCTMCPKPPSACEGSACKDLIFSSEGECHTLTCFHKFDGGRILVSIGEDKEKFGTFKCSPDNEENDKSENDVGKAVWKFKDEKDKSFKYAKTVKDPKCFDNVDCEITQPLKIECDDVEKNEGCPTINKTTNLVTCESGFNLKVIESENTIVDPFKVQCDRRQGKYHYWTKKEGNPTRIEKNGAKVTCARIDPVEEKTGLPLWQWIVITFVVLTLIALLILCICCVLRSKKKEAERKALLKRNDSSAAAPSSVTDSNKPQLNRGLVHMQPCSTAKLISSEQISEATAVEKTKKDMAEKTMLEPTLDLATAYSHDKSRQSKRETGSIETEIIDDGGKRGRSEKQIPDMEESAPSAKASQVSKKSKKDSGKDDKIKPQKFELNEKEKQIAKGVWRRNEDYPTMADIESDWDDAKDGKPPSKQRTATKDIPTADTPSARVAKIPDLNEKTAEMERLLAEPLSPLKHQRVTASEDLLPPGSRESSRASVRRNNRKMTALDVTQDQK